MSFHHNSKLSPSKSMMALAPAIKASNQEEIYTLIYYSSFSPLNIIIFNLV